MTVQFGYACLNMTLNDQKPRVTTNRGMIKRTWKAKGLAYASELALQNVGDLIKVIRWNNEHGVKVFRVSSCLFPWSSEYELEDLPDWPRIERLLRRAGDTAQEAGQRLSFHPGPFNVLASPNPDVVVKAAKELRTHGEIFDAMGLPQSHNAKINIHVGGAYGDREAAMERFCEEALKLPDCVIKRLTVENDDRPNLYSTKMLYEGVSQRSGIPIVFDSHHFACGPEDVSYSESIDMAVSTWPDGIRPTCHHSNSRQDEDPKAVRKAHSDWYRTPFESCGHSVDVVLECKMKELALFKYMDDFMKLAA